jgi:hypothetical protein
MKLDEFKQRVFTDLDTYEDSVRRYCNKVDEDRPWVGSAIWQAHWNFRKGLITQFRALQQDIIAAKQTQDPG